MRLGGSTLYFCLKAAIPLLRSLMSTPTWALRALMLAAPATVRIRLARMPMMAMAINSSSSVKAAGARRGRAGRRERPGAEHCMGGRLLLGPSFRGPLARLTRGFCCRCLGHREFWKQREPRTLGRAVNVRFFGLWIHAWDGLTWPVRPGCSAA